MQDDKPTPNTTVNGRAEGNRDLADFSTEDLLVELRHRGWRSSSLVGRRPAAAAVLEERERWRLRRHPQSAKAREIEDQVAEMRDRQGWNFAQIGRALGINRQRAHSAYLRVARRRSALPLSTRAQNCLQNVLGDYDRTRTFNRVEITPAIVATSLTASQLLKTYNLGKKSVVEIAEWLEASGYSLRVE